MRWVQRGKVECVTEVEKVAKVENVEKVVESSAEFRYGRCELLQLKPNDSTFSPSPWASGSLYCASRQQLASVMAEPARLRAASADPIARNKPTTVMLSNIPVEYTRTRFCEKLAEHGFGYAVDFLYLPIDSSTGRNVGHAFINLRTKDAFHHFLQTFQHVPARTCLPDFPSATTCHVKTADVQGREANMRNLLTASNLSKWANHEDWQPLFLDDYGTKIPFSQWQCSDGQGKQRRCASAKNSPILAPQQSPVLKPQPNNSQMKASSPEFVPQKYMPNKFASPTMRAEAKEFVPSMTVMLPEAELVD
mmetsp:Transcript_123523/g.349191  ORF Transcript_123523/g.349191 Transcript_123523/m.349191 type:complete len:307 (-) Transcript_123523:105-1025(-)